MKKERVIVAGECIVLKFLITISLMISKTQQEQGYKLTQAFTNSLGFSSISESIHYKIPNKVGKTCCFFI